MTGVPRRAVRVVIYAGMLVACAATAVMALVTTWTALTQPTRTFAPTLGLAAAIAYACGRTRPLRRLYDRLDDANDRALRDWRKGDRLWAIAVAYIALHPFRFAASAWKVKRDDRARRREATP